MGEERGWFRWDGTRGTEVVLGVAWESGETLLGLGASVSFLKRKFRRGGPRARVSIPPSIWDDRRHINGHG